MTAFDTVDKGLIFVDPSWKIIYSLDTFLGIKRTDSLTRMRYSQNPHWHGCGRIERVNILI
jgi:hypothetical protein